MNCTLNIAFKGLLLVVEQESLPSAHFFRSSEIFISFSFLVSCNIVDYGALAPFSPIYPKKKYEKLCSFWDFEANGESMLCSDLCILFFRFTKENIHLGCQLIHLSHLGIKLRRDTDGTCYQANKPTCIWWHWLDIAALKNKWGKHQTGPRCCKLK